MQADHAVLTDRGVIEVSGQDARDFLQRLITNDVGALAAGEARYAALLTPQGKITADFFVVAAGPTALYLDAPEGLVEGLAKKLAMYRLRAKVDIVDRSPNLGVLAFGTATPPVEAVAAYDDPRAPGLWRRAIVDKDKLQDLGSDAGRWAYREQRIRAGVPEGGIDFVYGETFPHEANFDWLHGVDFKKGCYIGQEVVSRVEHRGTARKRVVGVRFEGEPPEVGSDITVDGLSIGTMGSTVDGIGLGLIRLDRAEEARLERGRRVLAGGVPLRLEGPGWNSAGKSA
jgi:folate-binding protein YgfZ